MKVNFHKIVIAGGFIGLTAISAFAGYWDSFRLKLESNDYHWALMRVPTDRPIRLVKRLSKANCDYGRDWGITDRGIWVDHGCRAVFEVAGHRPDHWHVTWERARLDGDRDHRYHEWNDRDYQGWHHQN